MSQNGLTDAQMRTYLYHLKTAGIDPAHVAAWMAANGYTQIQHISGDELPARLAFIKSRAADIFCFTLTKAYRVQAQKGSD